MFDTILLVLAGLGVLVAIVGGLMQLVAAFRVHILWGLGSLFIAPVSLIFLIIHWGVAKKGFLTGLAGMFLLVGSLYFHPQVQQFIANPAGFSTLMAKVSHQNTAGPLDAASLTLKIDAKRVEIENLQAKFDAAKPGVAAIYRDLAKKRETLTDPTAIRDYNIAAADYTRQNNELKEMETDLQTFGIELDALLAQRSLLQSNPVATVKP